MNNKPIGIFDSGYGGLTVLKSIVEQLPEFDYVYIGDNARTPYGTRSYETVYDYTLQAVKTFFEMGCELVILACNTASAKALRSIQQKDLSYLGPDKRVLGVIRPSAEAIGDITNNNHVGIFGTPGTVNSESYLLEIAKLYPQIKVTQEACPLWVPLNENNQFDNEGGDYFVKHHVDALLKKDSKIDTIILGCTHYPLLQNIITSHLLKDTKVLSQGDLVAKSLSEYLKRHSELAAKCSKKGTIKYYTTDDPSIFDERAEIFLGKKIKSEKIKLLC
jgi:glutamate racemase